MKRRTFTLGLGALFAAPAMPAAAIGASPAAPLTAHMTRAKLLARCHGSASPAMLGRLMKLDGATAQGVFEMLQDQGVIARGLDGIARAVTPLNTHCIPTEAVRARDIAQQSTDARSRLKKVWDHLANDDTPIENEDQEALVDDQIETNEDQA